MKHRIFIAINLPEEIKKELLDYQSKWPDFPIRWTKRDSLHITLIFIGYVKNEDIPEICKITREAVVQHQTFSINLNKICYAPPKKIPPRSMSSSRSFPRSSRFSTESGTPRMIWAEGEKVKELADLKQDLEKSLAAAGIRFESNNREFHPHITLGRIRTWEWKRIEPEERPEIEKEISLNFEVLSIEVMESKLKRTGAEYSVLESIALG